MASTFLTVLGAVPWSKVLEYAPQAVEHASKLLSGLRKSAPDPVLPAGIANFSQVEALLDAQRIEIETLRAELTHSTEIILELTRTQAAVVAQVRKLDLLCRCTAGFAVACLVAALLIVAL